MHVKWAGIIGVVVLILGGLALAGVWDLAAGPVKLGFFLAVALFIGGWMVKRKLKDRR
jgi:hypothetical protein